MPAAIVLFVGIVAILSVLVYKVSHPEAVLEGVNPSHYRLPSLEVIVPSTGGYDIEGWWIPGLKTDPGIILAPGYGMNRVDSLSLAAALHKEGFNLLVYNQRGQGQLSKVASTLGLYEADDMSNALRYMQSRLENKDSVLGIWGVDVGARAALTVSAEFPQVHAIVADSAYDAIADFLDYRIVEDFGLDNSIVNFGCYQIFRLAHYRRAMSMNDKLPVQALYDRTVLFIKGENRPRLASLTTAIYGRIRPQKEMVPFPVSATHMMSEEDSKNYNRKVVGFFTLNLR